MAQRHHPEPAAPAMQKLLDKHPLQRLCAPSRGISAAVHVLGIASFCASFKYLLENPNHISAGYGWHFQYLTILGLTSSLLTFVLGLLADIFLSPSLFHAKNILSSCTAPLETLISVLYWTIRAIDPALVVPPELELPLAQDLGFHAVPALLLGADLLLLSPPWAIGSRAALLLSAAIAFAYWFWVEWCFSYNGFYPYPLFELLDTKQRVALFGGSAVFMAASTQVLKSVYAWVNGVDVSAVGKTK